jgi:flagellar hook-associated protein 3 FlgL
MYRNYLADLNSAHSKLLLDSRKLSTMRELNNPHDDPFGTGQALSLESQIADIAQFKRNVSDARSMVDTAEASLGGVTSTLQRVRELMLQAGNSTNDQSALNSIAAEIQQLKETVRDAANTRYAGLYVFSGTATTTQPYPPPGNAYAGNTGQIIRRISPGLQMQINVDGPTVFGTTTGPLPSQMSMFDLLDQIVADLQSGVPANRANVATIDLDAIDMHMDSMLQQRANLGALAKRLEGTDERLVDFELQLKEAHSKIVDADLAETMVDYQSHNTAYEAALAAGSRLMQTTILDFI